MTTANVQNRKKSFAVIFFIEMWERFGYYGMAALMVLFMSQKLGFSDQKALLTWGAFAALVYATPAVGGWIGDQILGTRRTMTLGALTLALGYILLSIPNDSLLYFALGVVAVGNGLFKANPGSLISRLYEGDASATDSAFTYYYMSVNLGAFISQIATPLIAKHVGWHAAFAFCAGGMLLGLLTYYVLRALLRNVGSDPDFKPLDLNRLFMVIGGTVLAAVAVMFILQSLAVARAFVVLAGIALAVIFIVMISRGNVRERNGLIAVLILTLQTILFFIFYQQMSTSLTLFALRNVNLDLNLLFMSLHIEPAQFQVLNPMWIFLLSPLLAWIYVRLGRDDRDISIAGKFAMGFAVLSVGFFIYGLSGNFAVDGRVSAWFMIWGFFFQSLGELLISGLGLAMVSHYVPARLRGFMMGAWFLATGISQYLGSIVANFASVPSDVTDAVQSLPLYTNLFMKLGFVAVAGTVIAVALLPFMKKLSDAHREEMPSPASVATEEELMHRAD